MAAQPVLFVCNRITTFDHSEFFLFVNDSVPCIKLQPIRFEGDLPSLKYAHSALAVYCSCPINKHLKKVYYFNLEKSLSTIVDILFEYFDHGDDNDSPVIHLVSIYDEPLDLNMPAWKVGLACKAIITSSASDDDNLNMNE